VDAHDRDRREFESWRLEPEFVTPGQDDPHSRYRIRVRSVEVAAQLGGDLISHRLLLRITENDARRLWARIGKLKSFQRFRAQVRSKNARNLGNISVAKWMARDIKGDRGGDTDFGVDTHWYGYVPVLIMRPSYIVPVNGEPKTVWIAICPALPRQQRGRPAPWTKEQLLGSYLIDFALLFDRYLWSVARHFSDMERLSSRITFSRRGKWIEEILARSVKSKLEDIRKSLGPKATPGARRLAVELRERHAHTIILVAYARVFALYLLNQLYAFAGYSDHSQEYLDEWERALPKWLSDLVGADVYDEATASGSCVPLGILRETMRCFHAEDDTRYDDLKALSEGYRWVKGFVDFAQFVAIVRRAIREGALCPEDPRLFVSRQLEVPMADRIDEILKEEAANRENSGAEARKLHLLTVRDEPGNDLRRAFRAHIWLSDWLLAIITKDWCDRYGQSKNLTWILFEIEQALTLDKPVTLLIEQGTETRRIEQEIIRHLRRPSELDGRVNMRRRMARLMDRVRRIGYLTVRTEQLERRDPEFLSRMGCVFEQARKRHAESLVLGLRALFARQHQRLMPNVLRQTERPRTRTELCENLAEDLSIDLSEAERLFGNLWNRGLRSRKLRLDGQDCGLVALKSRKYYTNNLREVLGILRPELSDAGISEWAARLVGQMSGA